jgi:hypothetical protein
MSKPNIIFDFDGVIHSYKSGWQGSTVISDEPVPGINVAIQEIRKEYRVIVVSTRCYQEGGIEAIRTWLIKHNIEVDDVTSEKPPALVTIDDRAITFDGNPYGLIYRIREFQPWYIKPPFDTWAWMQSWVDAYESQVGNGKAKDFIDWVHQQPMQQG